MSALPQLEEVEAGPETRLEIDRQGMATGAERSDVAGPHTATADVDEGETTDGRIGQREGDGQMADRGIRCRSDQAQARRLGHVDPLFAAGDFGSHVDERDRVAVAMSGE